MKNFIFGLIAAVALFSTNAVNACGYSAVVAPAFVQVVPQVIVPQVIVAPAYVAPAVAVAAVAPTYVTPALVTPFATSTYASVAPLVTSFGSRFGSNVVVVNHRNNVVVVNNRSNVVVAHHR